MRQTLYSYTFTANIEEATGPSLFCYITCWHQRVLNTLKSARFYRGRLIWLLAHPPPPPAPVSKLDRRHTGRLRKSDSLRTGEVGERVGEKPTHTTDYCKKAWSSINPSILSCLHSNARTICYSTLYAPLLRTWILFLFKESFVRIAVLLIALSEIINLF